MILVYLLSDPKHKNYKFHFPFCLYIPKLPLELRYGVRCFLEHALHSIGLLT